jgi:MFS family permease
LLIFTLNMSLPCFSSFVVLYARQLGVSHFAWYYVAVGLTSACARPILGRFSDRLGAGRSLLIAFALETTALLIMPLATGLAGLIVSGALWFSGAAIGGARIMALAIESAPAERRGRAMASFSTAFPLSNGTGAFINGIVVDLAHSSPAVKTGIPHSDCSRQNPLLIRLPEVNRDNFSCDKSYLSSLECQALNGLHTAEGGAHTQIG